MAIIPPDAAVRLRMQTEANLTSVAALKPLPADLPDLLPGQTFTARIQQALPENTYRALVAGKEITLSLPEAARSGDTLELVVVERGTRMVMAQLASAQANRAAANDTAESGNTTQLSSAGQLISKLLLPAGEKPQPVMLNQGVPLLKPPLPAAADLAAALAPRLEQAATQSGLFYESHQALWLSGQHDTEALLQEPQARHALPAHEARPSQAGEANLPARNATLATLADADNNAATRQQANIADAETMAAPKDPMQSIPAELRPLVQQQLDAAATQRLAWQGEVWPGQTMQWQISREAPDRASPTAEEVPQWNTSLALTTPVLGRIDAALSIIGNTVRIKLAAGSPESVPKLNARLAGLQSALEAAGLKPAGLQVRDGNA